jgi:hypothetical protein
MAVEAVKAMQAEGLDWGEGYRPLGRQALQEIIEDQTAALAFDHHDGLEAPPLVARLQPAEAVDHRVVSRLDTAVIGVECFVAADRRILVFRGFLFIDEDLDILAQGSPIALQRENATGFFLDDFFGDVALTTHRVDRHDRALDRHHVEQRRDGDDLVRLLVDLHLAQRDASPRREGGDDVDRLIRTLLLIRAPRRLGIDRDDLGWRVCQRRDPGHEAKLEGTGIERGEDIAEMIMGGRTVHIGPKPPQQFDLALAKPRYVGERLHPPREPPEESREALPAADNPFCRPDDEVR